jgi:hypothetical protein
MTAILFKATLALTSGLLGAWALRSRLIGLPERRFLLGALALQLVPAVGMFVGLYILGHQEPTSDVPGYYLPAARAALAGQVPFRDFALSYAPGFPYVGATLAWVWNSGKAFALFAIVVNAFALVWWHSAARTFYDGPLARECTVLYATCGHVLIQSLLGTNQAWIGAGLAASAMLIVRDRSTASGLAQTITACTTKVLAHLFWPLLWICAHQRSRWLLGAIVPTAAFYGVFAVLGAGTGLLYPLRHEGELISPGNIPYLLDPLLGAAGSLEQILLSGLTLMALAVTTGWLWLLARQMPAAARHRLLLAGLALTGLVFMLFSKKSFTGYVIFVLYPIVLMFVASVTDWRTRIGFLTLFNLLLVVEPSLWFYLEGNRWTLRTWFAMGGGGAAVGFVLFDVALVACYVYLAWLSVRGIRTTVAGAMDSRNLNQSATAWSLV